MANKKKLSVCCITYNQEDYIEKALEGFVKQIVGFEIEILIHDDASTDGTAKIIKKFERNYPNLFKVIYSKNNIYSQGQSPINKLLKMSSGDYIAFCEGDDFWIDYYKLNKPVESLESNNEYIATYHNVRVIDQHGNVFMKEQNSFPLYKTHDVYLNEIKSGRLCGQLASLVCKNIWKTWEKEKMDTFFSYKLNDDVKISSLMVFLGKVLFFEDIMACYRRTYVGDSWNAQMHEKNLTNHYIDANEELNRLYSEFFKINRGDYTVNAMLYAFKFFCKTPNLENWNFFIKTIKISNNKIKNISYLFYRIFDIIIPLRKNSWEKLN